MKEMFVKRRQAFHSRCLKYLKYVLNDHFVIVLLFLVGFLLFQYSQLLKHFPTQPLGLILFLSVLIIGGLPLGTIATFLEPADQVFVLAKEGEIVDWIKEAAQRSFILWGALQVVFLLVLYPIFVALHFPLWGFVVLVAVLVTLKFFIFQYKLNHFVSGTGRLNWKLTIVAEQKRQQSILKFFALFTTVKGISSAVKRRAYLDKLTVVVAKQSAQTWHNLYLRAFLRSGDYLGLTIRLVVLATLSLLFVKVNWLAVGLAFLFTYLLAFQLLALYKHYDYQYMTAFFPLAGNLKKRNLLLFLRSLIYGITVVEMACAGNLKYAALLLCLNIILVEGYLRYKVKKMID